MHGVRQGHELMSMWDAEESPGFFSRPILPTLLGSSTQHSPSGKAGPHGNEPHFQPPPHHSFPSWDTSSVYCFGDQPGLPTSHRISVDTCTWIITCKCSYCPIPFFFFIVYLDAITFLQVFFIIGWPCELIFIACLPGKHPNPITLPIIGFFVSRLLIKRQATGLVPDCISVTPRVRDTHIYECLCLTPHYCEVKVKAITCKTVQIKGPVWRRGNLASSKCFGKLPGFSPNFHLF